MTTEYFMLVRVFEEEVKQLAPELQYMLNYKVQERISMDKFCTLTSLDQYIKNLVMMERWDLGKMFSLLLDTVIKMENEIHKILEKYPDMSVQELQKIEKTSYKLVDEKEIEVKTTMMAYTFTPASINKKGTAH